MRYNGGNNIISRLGCKDQESIQSSTTPDTGYQYLRFHFDFALEVWFNILRYQRPAKAPLSLVGALTAQLQNMVVVEVFTIVALRKLFKNLSLDVLKLMKPQIQVIYITKRILLEC